MRVACDHGVEDHEEDTRKWRWSRFDGDYVIGYGLQGDYGRRIFVYSVRGSVWNVNLIFWGTFKRKILFVHYVVDVNYV